MPNATQAKPTSQLNTVRRAILLGARAAHTEQEVAVRDEDDVEGYRNETRASEPLEDAIAALQEADGPIDLYALAVSVRLTMRRRNARRMGLAACDERASWCRFYRQSLKRWPETRGTARKVLAGLREKMAERIAFAEAAGRA